MKKLSLNAQIYFVWNEHKILDKHSEGVINIEKRYRLIKIIHILGILIMALFRGIWKILSCPCRRLKIRKIANEKSVDILNKNKDNEIE